MRNFKELLVRGFFPAVPIPRDSNGNIMEDVQVTYAKYMSNQPITGVSLWVHTGRGLMLTKEQRETVFKAWRSNLSEEKAIICGVGAPVKDYASDEDYIAAAVEMGIHAKTLGADAILIYAPVRFRGRENQDELVIKYHNAIAKAVGLPIVLFFLYEAAGGVTYSLEVLEQLFAIDGVVAIKMATLDSVMTFQDVSNLINEKFPNITLYTGEDRMFGYTLARGSKGALVGMGAVCQKLQMDMIHALFDKDYAKFFELMVKVDALAECTFVKPMEGYIEKMLYILSLQGIIPAEAVHDPYGPGVTDEERAHIVKTLKALGELA